MSVSGIIDTHIHFIDPARFTYHWLGRRPDVDRRFVEDDYRYATTGGANVAGVVLVEAAVQDADAMGEAHWMSGIAMQSELVGAVVAQARLERGAAVCDELDRLAQLPKVTGIRRVVRAPFQQDPDFCVRPDFIAGVRMLADYNFSFDVACGPGDLSNVATLAEACPEVSLVINHIANPPSEPTGRAMWEARLRDLARRPNVACKISGQQTHLAPGWDVSTVRPLVEPAVDAFGARRVIFGSDTPVQNSGGGFFPWLGALKTIFATASEEERSLFFEGNARGLYRIAQRPPNPVNRSAVGEMN
jgi:L-fuconolactonase